MRLSLTASYLLLITCAAGQTAQLRWDVQQDRPVSHDVYIWQGETVDLMPRLVQGTQPVAVTNAPVEFRYREAALPPNQYRSVAAAANTNSGVLLVRWLPEYDAGADWYDYQIIVGSNAANPRAFGRITMRPTIGWPASTNAPPAILQYLTAADLQAASNALAAALQPLGPRLDLIEEGTNNWSAAYSWGDHAAAGYLLPAALAPYATTQQVAEAAAIPRDRITTLDGSQWIDATGSVWRVTTSTVPDTSRLVIWHNIPGAPWPDAFVIDPFDPSSGYNEFVGFRWYLNLSSAGSVSSSYVMDYETGDMWSAVFDSDPLDYPVTLEKVDESSGMIVEYATSTIVTTSRVDGVAWQSDLPLYATTQQVAAALAPMATTGHVAQAIAAIPDSIVRGVSVSSTNILVSSTNSVYYVALDNAANIGFDFSALSLGGTKRADITAVIDCLNTQALYSVINTNLVAMDCPWEPTVTGRYELAVSSDGVRTTVRQVSPQQFCWSKMVGVSSVTMNESRNGSSQVVFPAADTTNSFQFYMPLRDDLIFDARVFIFYLDRNDTFKLSWARTELSSYVPFQSPMTNDVPSANTSIGIGYTRTVGYIPSAPMTYSSEMGLKITVMKSAASNGDWRFYTPFVRRANSLERAAFNAGSYPAAFRLDY